MNKEVSINQLKPVDFFELKKYLQKFNDETQKDKIFLNSHISNFFLDLTLEEEVELCDILESEDANRMESFINAHPNIKVRLDGSGKLKQQPGWSVLQKTLLLRYDEIYAKEKNKLTQEEKQIIKARDLRFLNNSETVYPIEYIYKSINDRSLTYRISTYRKDLADKFDSKLFLEKVFSYFLNHRNINSIGTLIDYVFHFLSILRSDIHGESKLGNEYLEKIHTILKSD